MNGWDEQPQRIPKDINSFRDDIVVFEHNGPVGAPVNGITEITVETVETGELYQSAAIASKQT